MFQKTIIRVVKKISNLMGYKVVMIKKSDEKINFISDGELFEYVDSVGYIFKKEPLKREIEN